MDDKEDVVAAVVEQPKARKPRKPAVKKKKPTTGRKTLIAALVAVAIASVDLYITVRYPGSPGACQILRDML